MTISQRIFMLLKQKGKKQKELAEYTGISTSAISAWNKNNTNPTAESLSIIADFLEVSLDYLLTGKEKTIENTEDIKELLDNYNMVDDISKQLIQERAKTLAELAAKRAAKERAAEQPQKEVQIDEPAADERITPDDPENNQSEPTEILSETQVFSGEEPRKLVLQLFDLPVSAGTGVILSDNCYEPIEVYWSPEAEQANYVLRVSGNSMEDDFHEGDLVLVESVKDISVGEIGIFVADGEGYIKVKGENALISLNSSYKPKPYSKFSTIQCIGRVLGKAKMV